MTKKTVLERFKEIEELEVADGPEVTVKDILPYFCENVEQVLQRLEAIDNVTPSEAFKCILDIENNYKFYVHNKQDIDYQCAIIKQSLLKAREQEKEIAYIEKIKTMMKQKDCALRYIESEDCFAVKTILSDGWYKLTPAFVDDNVREEIKPLPLIEKINQLKEENAELKAKAQKPKQYIKWENLTFSKETTYVNATLNGVVVTLACWVDNSKEWCRVDFDNAPCNNMVFVHHGYNDDTDTQQLLFDALGFVEA